MDVRKNLVEILLQEDDLCERGKCKDCFANGSCYYYRVTDRLIANGVTVQEWYYASNPPKEDGTYLVQTNTGTITTARFYAFKSFHATKYLPACHRSPSWQSNRNVVKWTFLPKPPKGE